MNELISGTEGEVVAVEVVVGVVAVVATDGVVDLVETGTIGVETTGVGIEATTVGVVVAGTSTSSTDLVDGTTGIGTTTEGVVTGLVVATIGTDLGAFGNPTAATVVGF